MKIGMVIGGRSPSLSHLLKLGGSFETAHGHLARAGESQQYTLSASVLSGLSSLALVVRKVAFFSPPLLNEKPLSPLLQVCAALAPSGLAFLPFRCKYLANLQGWEKSSRKLNEGQLKPSFLNPPQHFTALLGELWGQLLLTLQRAALAPSWCPRFGRGIAPQCCCCCSGYAGSLLLEVERCQNASQ